MKHSCVTVLTEKIRDVNRILKQTQAAVAALKWETTLPLHSSTLSTFKDIGQIAVEV